ncbi:hypothetical protein Aduo_011705 [Ancylostoma duodenale]
MIVFATAIGVVAILAAIVQRDRGLTSAKLLAIGNASPPQTTSINRIGLATAKVAIAKRGFTNRKSPKAPLDV